MVTESVEEYLESLWIHEEQESEETLARIKWIAKQVDVTPPSAVEILKRMEDMKLVEYQTRLGVKLTAKGRQVARQIIRNHRLIEVLMKETLGQEVDEKVACGIEHHMTEEFADALCTQLDHPRFCPHGNSIPRGGCCSKNIPDKKET